MKALINIDPDNNYIKWLAVQIRSEQKLEKVVFFKKY